jgi:hypothetical protein
MLRYIEENSKFYLKISIHLLVALCLVDIIWMAVIFPHWFSKAEGNAYWESLSTLHTFTAILSGLNLLVKGVIIFFAFNTYKIECGEISDLFKLTYEAGVKRIFLLLK